MKAPILLAVTALALAAFVAGAPELATPHARAGTRPGATARCRDGTYSYSRHRSGTCSYHGGVARWIVGARATAISSRDTSVGQTIRLAPRTRTQGCRRGTVPDRRCSPGAFSSGLTRGVLCSSSFHTSAVRNVPQSEKFAVEREYGMAPRFYGRSLEIDHIVSLELGGSNDIANLFPEPGSGPANYHDKDRLENRLHDLVCSGTMSLRAAQRGIARDWEALYTRVFGIAASR